MRKVKIRIQKGKVVEPAELPDEAEGWLTIPEEVEEVEAPETLGDIWADYDPEKVREALRRSAGALKGLDTKQFIQYIYEARGQDSRGRPGD